MNDSALNLIAVANELEAFIKNAVIGSSSLNKYGGTLFTLKPDEKEGQFCGVFVYSKHIQISFSQGSQLDDPRKLLKGSGKHRRHINFESINDVDFPYLENLLIQSSRL